MPTDQLPAYTADVLTHQRSIDYIRFVSCLVANDDAPALAAKVFAMRWPQAPHRDLVQRAAVTASTTTDAAAIAPLEPLASAFLSYSRPLSLIGRLPLRHVPFNVAVPQMTAPTVASWAGEGAPKAVSKGALATITLGITKAADTIIETAELVKLLVPGAEIALRADLANAIAQFLDAQFCDPAVAGVPTVTPASITNGITPLAPSGTTSAALVTDLARLIAQFTTANPDTTTAVIVMMPGIASQLIGATNSQTLLANSGGTYGGFPVVVSGSVGSRIIMLDGSSILLADGGVEISTTRQATLQIVDNPDNPLLATSVLTSLWQYDLVGLRVERFVHWKRSRTSAVSLISPTAYVPGT